MKTTFDDSIENKNFYERMRNNEIVKHKVFVIHMGLLISFLSNYLLITGNVLNDG